jgi:hypothetical protein
MIDNEEFVFPASPPDNRFYVYYNSNNGSILAVANGLLDREDFNSYIEISPELHQKLSSDTVRLLDWAVVKTPTANDNYIIEIVPKNFKGLSFENKMFDLILNEPTIDTELTVEWSLATKHWVINILPDTKLRLMGKKFLTEKLSFFIVLENDFDFLIRKIFINSSDLMNKEIYIPFESKIEEQIDNISVVTRKLFNNYGLIKTYE